MSTVTTNIKKEMQQPINLVASIVTIINFIWSIQAFNSHDGVPTAAIPAGSVAVGFILACLLEALLATAFGYAIVYVNSKGNGLPYLLAIVLMLISAWTSLFNAQWLVLGQAPTTGAQGFGLFAMGVFFAGFACYLIGDHVNKFKLKLSSVNDFVKSLNSDGGLYVWQALSFLLMFGFIIGQSDFN
ncbi:hypothetical protein VIOR3934_16576 [Vibrio orientalis CIP 102891 = ATCC 33934]|uniref:Uncharacterized protein n=2 Tax=Vibrio orientalis CIP 102891 = ATCC 33934 TaxID=675816 RepID=F9SXC9_VIBOR|nr:hypothetical protein [Vibrio orientalis]EGU46897.1 hypothetical protein VIOR3934_16576 [Vibrio orientalis CIP 102891 = ATCC 33934]